MNEVTFRRAVPTDVAAIKRLLWDSFDAGLRPYMTYLQSGIDSFLSVPLLFPEASPERFLLVVAEDSDPSAVLGFAEFKKMDAETGFLSYICVDAGARGRGLASRMISTYVDNNAELTELQLDVFTDNIPATSLYRKLGFKARSTVNWIVRDIPASGRALRFHALHNSLAAHEKFGFSEFLVHKNEGGQTKVGRIGEGVVRCFALEEFQDQELLAGMKHSFPQLTAALCIVDSSLPVDNCYRCVQRSTRMRLDLRLTPAMS